MARITMRKVQETKLSEVFSLYLASAAAKGVKDKTLKTYEQHFNAISKRLNVDSNISLTTSKDLDILLSILLRNHLPHFLVRRSFVFLSLCIFIISVPFENLSFYMYWLFLCNQVIEFRKLTQKPFLSHNITANLTHMSEFL